MPLSTYLFVTVIKMELAQYARMAIMGWFVVDDDICAGGVFRRGMASNFSLRSRESLMSIV
jgi:hypothetical protein